MKSWQRLESNRYRPLQTYQSHSLVLKMEHQGDCLGLFHMIPNHNLDPDKKYTSITVTADMKSIAVIEATTLASEKRE